MVLRVMVCIMSQHLYSTSFTIKHLWHSSLYVCTLFVEPHAIPITTDRFLQASAIPNATLLARGIIFS